MLKRKAMDRFEEWYRTRAKRALLVTGARQVGKTFLVREFAAKHWAHVVEINFFENSEARAAVESAKNSSELFLRLTAFANAPLVYQAKQYCSLMRFRSAERLLQLSNSLWSATITIISCRGRCWVLS